MEICLFIPISKYIYIYTHTFTTFSWLSKSLKHEKKKEKTYFFKCMNENISSRKIKWDLVYNLTLKVELEFDFHMVVTSYCGVLFLFSLSLSLESSHRRTASIWKERKSWMNQRTRFPFVCVSHVIISLSFVLFFSLFQDYIIVFIFVDQLISFGCTLPFSFIFLSHIFFLYPFTENFPFLPKSS